MNIRGLAANGLVLLDKRAESIIDSALFVC